MESLELERLFLLYKSGHNFEPDSKRPEWQRQFHSDVLQIANATDPELSEEDFAFIAMQVETLSSMHNKEWPRSEWDKNDKTSTFREGSHEGRLEGWLSKGEYQKMIWDLPEFMQKRHKPFRPTRDRQNKPVERSSAKGASSVASWAATQSSEASSMATPPVPVIPTINPAEVRKAIMTGRNEDDSEHPGEPAPGMVRVYHTGSVGSGSAMDKRWVTTQENYNFRADAPLHYLDLPETDKRLTPEYPEQSIKQGFHRNFELEPHEAAKLKPIPKRKPQSENKSSWDEAQASNAAWIESTKADLLKSVFGKDREGAESSAAEGPMGGAASQPSSGSSFIDKLQNVLDAVGVVDPTPITDGVNMAISLGRAFTDPGRAGSHLVNAATSAVSMVPLVGDLAKLGKFGARATAHGGAGSNIAGMASAIGQATAGGMGGGGHVPTPPMPPSNGGGSGSNNSGGMIPSGSGGVNDAIKWTAIGGALFVGFRSMADKIGLLRDITRTDRYTGDGFDSMKSVGELTDKTIDATMPLAKHMPFEQLRRAGVRYMNGIVDWLKQIEQSGNAMLNDNKRLAEYSGQIAVSFNQLDVNRVKRDIVRADAMGGELAMLTNAQNYFETQKANLFEPYERLMTLHQSLALYLGGGLMQLRDSVDVVGWGIEKLLGEKQMEGPRNGLEAAIQREEEEMQKKRKL